VDRLTDEEIAAELDASARRSQRRAAHASAAAALRRAAQLSADRYRRRERMAAAADASWAAGQADLARAAITDALPNARGQLRAHLLHLGGVIEARSGHLGEACDRLLEAADASREPSATLEMTIEAAGAAFFRGDAQRLLELDQRVSRLAPRDARDRLIVALVRSHAAMSSGAYQQAQRLVNEAAEQADLIDDPRGLIWAARAGSLARHPGSGLPFASRAVALARSQGLLGLLPLALAQQSRELIDASSFDLAYAAAEEGDRLAIDVGHGRTPHLIHLATIEAVWGRHEDAVRHAEQALALAQRSGSTFHLGHARWAVGLSELIAGHPADAAERLLAITQPDAHEFNPLVGYAAMPDAIEAAFRAGENKVGERLLTTYARWVNAAPTDARRALLARSRALAEKRDTANAFADAIRLKVAISPLQRARTELLYGEWLRRQRLRHESRSHLRGAHELFTSLGAEPLAQRAAAELRATGATIPRRDPSRLDQLTPQELQIATLVAQGLTNRDIAAQLFLSPRTIDYHLRTVLTKLGIASRAELMRDGVTESRDA